MKKLLVTLILSNALNCYALNKVNANFIVSCVQGVGGQLPYAIIQDDNIHLEESSYEWIMCPRSLYNLNLSTNRITSGAKKITFTFKGLSSMGGLVVEGRLKKDNSCAEVYLGETLADFAYFKANIIDLRFPTYINNENGIHNFSANIKISVSRLNYLIPDDHLMPQQHKARADRVYYEISNCKYEFIEGSK